jgi:hypothetical protein
MYVYGFGFHRLGSGGQQTDLGTTSSRLVDLSIVDFLKADVGLGFYYVMLIAVLMVNMLG